MAKKELKLNDRDEGTRGKLLTQQDNEKAFDKLRGLERATPDLSDNPPAESFQSTGRNCPQCSHRLRLFEFHKETGILLVQCTHCGRQYGHPDLEAPESDNIYRTIPADMKLRWSMAREKQLDREEEK